MDAGACLAGVDGGGGVVDGEAAGGEENGEVKELVQVALRR